jgi:3-deoxy-manno-octulosonate cytidylyltransferase (CMP-KDO synthetase)
VLESAEKLEQLRALEHGIKIKVVETPFDSIEVDVPEDIKRVEKMFCS